MEIQKNPDYFIKEISQKANSKIPHETLNTELEEISKDVNKSMRKKAANNRRGDNFRVTDLCNPVQALYDINGPHILNPEILKTKFRYGKFIEGRVNIQLSKEEGYAGSQGYVDGRNCGMPDVKGKIDFRIKERIIEFKTSEYDIPDEDALFMENPQDLEQLLLYILFSERTNSEHTLLYLAGKYPDLVPREFRVKIKDREKIVSYFKLRYDKLKKAIDTENPQGLGKCRYFNATCKFKSNGLCNCDNEEVIDISEIKNNVFVKLAEGGIGSKIANAQIFENYQKSIGIWDIFTPRKWFMKIKNPYKYDEWEDDDEDKYELRKEIENKLVEEGKLIRDRLSIDISEIKDHLLLKVPTIDPSTNQMREEKHPILIRIQDDATANYRLSNDYYVAQIGLACALSNNNTGFVFLFYRNSDVGRLYEIKFSKLGNIKQEALGIIKKSIKSAQKNELDPSLPLCPEFVMNRCSNNCACKDASDHVPS
jgi:hypothetical protein